MNQNTEFEINLKDLLIYWALHFRSAFVLCVCAFILLGSYKGYQAETAASQGEKSVEDSSTVTDYQMVVSGDPNFDAETSKKTYITVTGKDAATAQTIANALIQSMKGNDSKNAVYEIRIKAEAEAEAVVGEVSPVHAFIKYGIVGAVAMLFLHLLFFAIQYVASAVIITSSQQCEMLRIPVLSQKRGAAAKLYKHGTGLDRALRRAGGFAAEENDMNRVTDMAAANLKLELKAAGQQNAEIVGRRILVAGQAEASDKKALAEALAQRLEGITFTVAESLKGNPQDRERLLDCDGVLFAEVYGQTRRATALEEKSLVQSSEKMVLGSVWN
jgi:hypothetical protein